MADERRTAGAALRAADVRRRGVDVERREGPVAQPERRHASSCSTGRRTSTTSGPSSPPPWPPCRGCASGSWPASGRFSPPVWRPDPEFDLDYHIRQVALPAPGTERQLLDLVAAIYQDPYDRTRPLWMFHVIEGLEGGRGRAGVEDPPRRRRRHRRRPPRRVLPPADPRSHRRRRRSTSTRSSPMPSPPTPRSTARRRSPSAVLGTHHPHRPAPGGHRPAGARRDGDVGRRPAARPGRRRRRRPHRRARCAGRSAAAAAPEGSGSPLWRQRSRHRHLEVLVVPARPGAGRGEGPRRLAERLVRHRRRQRGDRLPRRARRAADDAEHELRRQHAHRPGDRRQLLHAVAAVGAGRADGSPPALRRDQRADARQPQPRCPGRGMMAGLAGIANLLPTSLVTGVARSQAARMDFATSNLRGAKVPLYISGARGRGATTRSGRSPARRSTSRRCRTPARWAWACSSTPSPWTTRRACATTPRGVRRS